MIEFEIGDLVEFINFPNVNEYFSESTFRFALLQHMFDEGFCEGAIGKIKNSQESDAPYVECNGFSYYIPAKHLRKLEEFNIGDKVFLCDLPTEPEEFDKIYQRSNIHYTNNMFYENWVNGREVVIFDEFKSHNYALKEKAYYCKTLNNAQQYTIPIKNLTHKKPEKVENKNESKFKIGDIVSHISSEDNTTLVMVTKLNNSKFSGVVLYTDSLNIQKGFYKDNFNVNNYELANVDINFQIKVNE